ncbi:cytoplasmic dynein 2 heavy chain 1-like, partial [Scleropages formosus]
DWTVVVNAYRGSRAGVTIFDGLHPGGPRTFDDIPDLRHRLSCSLYWTGMKELSPPPLSLKRLYQETLESEPILIIISPGADPSQELLELAGETVGRENYHELAMGQGQADIALQTLRECARNGEWLCLKNLHLVTSWLPLLEKELNVLQPKTGFRLWLTTEVHAKFPPVLLQSSLKITYEAPPGLKKNLIRTYESWSPEQGWTKFYEFSLSDLRAGFEIIDRLFEGAKEVQWEFVRGLLESAIYGGRIDNLWDLRVLRSYLEQFFNPHLISGSAVRGKRAAAFPAQINLPSSCSITDYRSIIDNLPEDDRPAFFGLPANIERSSQRIISSQVIAQLRVLSRPVTAGSKFDREVWSSGLSPLLNLWKKLNQGSSLIHQKVASPSENHSSPVLSFIVLEQFNVIRLVQSIHQSLAALSKCICASHACHRTSVSHTQCPLSWQDKWEGPDDPVQYLRAVVTRALAIQCHNLTLLPASHFLRATSCLAAQCEPLLHGLSKGSSLRADVGGLQLEGCSFDGSCLSENQHDSPSVSAVPPCHMAWIPQVAPPPLPLSHARTHTPSPVACPWLPIANVSVHIPGGN